MPPILVDFERFLPVCIYPLLCLCLIMDYRAPCAFSGPFWSQFEKAMGNHGDEIFLKKIHFFLILISEFQRRIYSISDRILCL